MGVLEPALRFFEELFESFAELTLKFESLLCSPKTLSPASDTAASTGVAAAVAVVTEDTEFSLKLEFENFTLASFIFDDDDELFLSTLSELLCSDSGCGNEFVLCSLSMFLEEFFVDDNDEKLPLVLFGFSDVGFLFELDVDDDEEELWTVFWWEAAEPLELDFEADVLEDFDEELLDLLALELLLRLLLDEDEEEFEGAGGAAGCVAVLLLMIMLSASFSGDESDEWLSAVGIGLYGGIVFTLPLFFYTKTD